MHLKSLLNQSWGAIKLPLEFDAKILQREVSAVSADDWAGGGRTSAAFANTKAIFLKGYAAAEGNTSLDDRAALEYFPYAKELMYKLIPAEPQKCVLSYLPAQERVGLHVDSGDYFNKTLRVHFPVVTNPKVSMYFGRAYKMQSGEVWLLNNCAAHGVENGHHRKSRIHLICDYLPSEELLELIAAGKKNLGKPAADLVARLKKKTQENSGTTR